MGLLDDFEDGDENAKKIVTEAITSGIKRASEEAMKINGSVVTYENGAVVRKFANGDTEIIKQIEQLELEDLIAKILQEEILKENEKLEEAVKPDLEKLRKAVKRYRDRIDGIEHLDDNI